MRTVKPTFGSLFAGVGGFDLGFEAAGWACKFQVENDKNCQEVLTHHWPNVARYWDIKDVNGAELPTVDCINFGSPCQDLSVAGKQQGLQGNRSGLFYEATRIIREMRQGSNNEYPKIAVWENVPGALGSNNGEDFAAVLKNLADLGALVIEWAVLDAQYYGVPQRRRRVFVVAILDPAIARDCPPEILPLTEGRRRNTKKGNTQRQRTTAEPQSSVNEYLPYVKVIRPQTDEHPEVWREEQIAPTLNAFDNGGEARATVIFTAQRVGETPRIYENKAPSLLSRMGTGGNNVPMTFSFGWQVRRLTPLECERLMGWPDDHTRYKSDGTEQADSNRYKQCGNGVVAPVAQWIAQHLERII